MNFNWPIGSGVLLCPFGATYSTISSSTWKACNDSTEDEVIQVNTTVWANWFANVKTATVSVHSRTETVSPFSVDESSEESTITQWRASGFTTIEENDSPYPLPYTEYVNNILRTLSPISILGPSEIGERVLYDDGVPGSGVGYTLPPGLFIWQGNFYALVHHYVPAGYGGTRSISITKDTITLTFSRFDSDAHYFITVTVKITETYY